MGPLYGCGHHTPASMTTARDDCFANAGVLMRHDEALRLLAERVVPRVSAEAVPLADAAGRVLAEAAIARHPVPAHTNAAVDGYAFAHAAYDTAHGSVHAVAGRAAAGHPVAARVPISSAVRIFTGAVMPQGLDTVAMQEDARIEAEGERVVLPAGLKKGANVRRAGEDVAAGTNLYAAGHVLRPQDLAGLASIGFGEVRCYRSLRVGIVASGDEVIAAGARGLSSGEVYDANTPMLAALVRLAGAEAEVLGIWPDKPEVVADRLAAAAGRFDVLLTSGGASLGDEDHMAAAIGRLGTRHLWQIAVKPGRPMMFGEIGNCVVMGLPGNPVAVFVCFLMYVHPLLRRLGGAPWPEPRRYRLPATFAFPKRKTGRREFWRGMIVETPKGLGIDKFSRDGSGLISGLTAADGLIDIPEHIASVQPGDFVSFIPFIEFGIAPRN